MKRLFVAAMALAFVLAGIEIGWSQTSTINALTELASEPAVNDELIIWDTSVSQTKKITIANTGLAFVYDTVFGVGWNAITAKAPSANVVYDKIITLAPIASPTFTGKITTAAGSTASAPLRIPHGYAPTTPVNGDVWTTLGGIYAYINGATVGPFGAGGGGGGGALDDITNPAGAKTFTLLDNNASALSFGSTGKADILKIVTTDGSEGVTMSGNLEVSGVATIAQFTLGAVSVSTSGTQLNYLNIATGTTGTESVVYSATPTFTGTPLAPTAAADTNTTQLATTAFVIGQISNTAYGGGWNGVTTQAPSKDAVYDQMELKLTTPTHVGGNCLVGYNGTGADGTLGCFTTITLDDSAAQIYNTAAPTKLVKIDASNQTAGNTGTIQAPNGGTAVLVAGTMLVTDGALGNATATTLLATGRVDGTVGMVLSVAASATTVDSTSNKASYYMNRGDSDAHSIFTLPTAAAGLQYCFRNYTGIVTVLTIQTSAAGQFIDLAGVNTASGGFIKSAGAAGDAACVVGVDATHWVAYTQSGTWSKD